MLFGGVGTEGYCRLRKVVELFKWAEIFSLTPEAQKSVKIYERQIEPKVLLKIS